jgi:hypothetical protein
MRRSRLQVIDDEIIEAARSAGRLRSALLRPEITETASGCDLAAAGSDLDLDEGQAEWPAFRNRP